MGGTHGIDVQGLHQPQIPFHVGQRRYIAQRRMAVVAVDPFELHRDAVDFVNAALCGDDAESDQDASHFRTRAAFQFHRQPVEGRDFRRP